METIQRKKGGLSTNTYFLQTGASNRRGRPGNSVCSTHVSYFQSKEKGIPQKRFSIRYSRGHKNLESKGYQIILMGEINKYILSKRIRTFTTKLGLWELITDIYESMGPDSTR